MAKRRNRKLRIEQLLKETAVPMYLLGPDREIVFLNAACEALTGRRAEQVIGLSCRYHGPAGTSELPDLGASLAPPPEVMAGTSAIVRSLIVQPDGTRLWRRIHFLPCRDGAQSLVAVIALISEDSGEPLPAASLPAEMHEELLELRDRLHSRFGVDKVIGSSDAMSRVIAQIRLAAQTDAGVLIWGEPGTGKSLVARTIHLESGRRAAPFLPVDCALLPPEMTERDLFGGRESAVSPALPKRRGLLGRPLGGTLFLKNLSHLPRDTQRRLLDVLESESTRDAASAAAPAPGWRIIAADQRDPARVLAASEVREDLFYSVTTVVIGLPPLRERKEDLPLLAQMFVESANARGEKQVSGLTASAIEVLLTYDWPGNVRELGEVIAAAHEGCSDHVIGPDELTLRIQGARGGGDCPTVSEDAPMDLDAVLSETERRLIEQAIKRVRGNKSAAADLLSISRPRLYRRMQILGMDGADDSESSQEPQDVRHGP